ncbi:hypothetical protein O6H91_15G033900 [Diphasiastrum complanatum]|uniref:Uncharacterized protein n=1 Tax=Diphasiastrum complanatum TaxID=34168 RepID=A0ACC2BH83_DIPCM|nr:hypothetical protein O6H91_15G033900 [Diphasiastrum complanatum]
MEKERERDERERETTEMALGHAISGHLSIPSTALSSPLLLLLPHSRLRTPSCFQSRKVYLLQKSKRCQGARAKVNFVDGQEAKRLATEEGYTILDIRDNSQYDRAHIPSSVHVPLFIDNNDNDIGTAINRALHNGFSGLFYGVAFTKPNPKFISEVEKTFSKDHKLLVVCQEGLRSGIAAEKLEGAGFQNLAYIASGLQSVKPGTFPKEGPKELEDAGKAGLVTIQGKFSAILGSVLVVAYLFLTLFPDQAEQLFFRNNQ